MVFVLDQGSVFDAPAEKIWRYLQTANNDEHAHRSMMNAQMEMDGDHPVLTFETEAPNGMKAKNKVRVTFFPPVGVLEEYIEGPLSGSRVMQHYIPIGDRTGVTVVGEYVSNMIPGDQLKTVVMAQLEQAFNEDNANLKRFK